MHSNTTVELDHLETISDKLITIMGIDEAATTVGLCQEH